MNHICTEKRRFEKTLEEVDFWLPVNVLEASEDLIKEVANMFIRNCLTSEQLVQVGFHEFLKMWKKLESRKKIPGQYTDASFH
jgi:hypothetical protein